MAAMRLAMRVVSLGARAHGAVVVRTCQMTRTCVGARRSGVFEQIRTFKSTPATSDPGQAVASAGGDAEIVPDFAPGDDVEMVVRNLLYNHPDPSDLPEDPDGQVLSILVEDEPGVLSRISSLLSSRGHNIKSLSVAPTNMTGLSRITITVLATLQETKKVVRQIEGVHEVLAVLQSARVDSVHREVVLLKMSTEYGNVKDKASRIDRVHKKRAELMQLAELFQGEIVDVGVEHVTIMLTAWPKRIDALIELARPYGIVEVARSGVIAMPRSRVGVRLLAEIDEKLALSELPPS